MRMQAWKNILVSTQVQRHPCETHGSQDDARGQWTMLRRSVHASMGALLVATQVQRHHCEIHWSQDDACGKRTMLRASVRVSWTLWDLSPVPSACVADVMPLRHVPLSMGVLMMSCELISRIATPG